MLLVGGVVALGLAAGAGFLYAGNALVPIRDSLRRQREFAADASHELRTPLTIVRGNVERLRRDPEPPAEERAEALDDIEVEVDHLTGLVDDLLLLARSDSGTVQLRRDPVDLAEVAGEALQRLRPLAESRGVTLSLDAAPAAVTGDADRLRQLVAILVDNAIRHSSAGGTVHVSISPAGRPSLRVDDEGQGIRPEDLPNVFERFYRAPDAPSGGRGWAWPSRPGSPTTMEGSSARSTAVRAAPASRSSCPRPDLRRLATGTKARGVTRVGRAPRCWLTVSWTLRPFPSPTRCESSFGQVWSALSELPDPPLPASSLAAGDPLALGSGLAAKTLAAPHVVSMAATASPASAALALDRLRERRRLCIGGCPLHGDHRLHRLHELLLSEASGRIGSTPSGSVRSLGRS